MKPHPLFDITNSARNILVAGAVNLLATTAPTHAAVISGPIVNPGNGHTYYLLSQNTWTASESEALTLGGHLATVRNLAENSWIYSQFSQFGGVNRGLWIGLNDATVEGTFAWSSGEAVSYLNWGLGEPVNENGADDYIQMFWPGDPRASNWNDQFDVSGSFGIPFNGVAEVIPEPTSMAMLLCGAGLLLRRRSRG